MSHWSKLFMPTSPAVAHFANVGASSASQIIFIKYYIWSTIVHSAIQLTSIFGGCQHQPNCPDLYDILLLQPSFILAESKWKFMMKKLVPLVFPVTISGPFRVFCLCETSYFLVVILILIIHHWQEGRFLSRCLGASGWRFSLVQLVASHFFIHQKGRSSTETSRLPTSYWIR